MCAEEVSKNIVKLLPINADVMNNIIDKISNAVGYIALPKGKRKYKLEAEEYLIKKFEANEGIPTLVKAALISNSRKILKEYTNQMDIMDIAVSQLDEKADANNLTDDWLSYFFDNCKDVSDEQVQIIWGKLLAMQCDGSDSIPRTTIHTLSILDSDIAKKFSKLCNFIVLIMTPDCTTKKKVIYDFYNDSFFLNYGITQEDLYEFETVGLIITSPTGYCCVSEDETKCYGEYKIIYNDFTFKKILDERNEEDQEEKGICSGNIEFTRTGYLISRMVTTEYIKEYDNYLAEYYEQLY